jgi:hypothetical protein
MGVRPSLAACVKDTQNAQYIRLTFAGSLKNRAILARNGRHVLRVRQFLKNKFVHRDVPCVLQKQMAFGRRIGI